MASSLPTKTDQAGFTLLEVEAAILLLSLLVIGMFQLVKQHQQLAAAADAWCRDEPSYFVQISSDELERVLGAPGELVDAQPAALPGPPAPDVYEVEITEYSQTLYPPSASASVSMTLNP